ncbi:MAG: hypothetical protein KME26_24625 [Oscillatoria princeps RMCB-10]|jgi:hypothetical protein|nr:hypothetical protein [Oscillatoria princeps RMCB-10]
MKDIAPYCSPEITSDRTANQPNPFFLAVALTAILYFSVGSALPNTTGYSSETVQVSANFSVSVASAVLYDAAARAQLPSPALHIVSAEPRTWQDDCLELGQTGGNCTPKQVAGWEVVVASQRRRWVYRTNASGSVVKLHENAVAPDIGVLASRLP